jgi:hypothetical protein
MHQGLPQGNQSPIGLGDVVQRALAQQQALVKVPLA